LTELRQGVGFTTTALAEHIGTGAPTVAKVENGLRSMSEVKLIQYLTIRGLKSDEIAPYLQIARTPDTGFHVAPFNDRMLDELIALVVHETTARMITDYECMYVPGLLQAEDYVRSLLIESGIEAPDMINRGAGRRLDRQSVLRKGNPPQATFFISEHVLRSTVGGAGVMNDQMMRLQFAADWDNCSVRVVPAARHGRVGTPGSFRLMTLRGSGRRPSQGRGPGPKEHRRPHPHLPSSTLAGVLARDA
jgi:transcriptional regulator with XRE-family HTH domain